MPSLDAARAALAARSGRRLAGSRRAAVAVVLREARGGVEILLIERARRLGDPWSGHMAFPGGRVDAIDADDLAAAVRETHEEVGLDLRGAELLGRLDDLRAGVPVLSPLVLCAFVFALDGPQRPRLELNREVAGAMWVPVATCLDPASHTGYRLGPLRLRGVCVGDPGRHVVWGLTYRLLESLFDVLATPLRAR